MNRRTLTAIGILAAVATVVVLTLPHGSATPKTHHATPVAHTTPAPQPPTAPPPPTAHACLPAQCAVTVDTCQLMPGSNGMDAVATGEVTNQTASPVSLVVTVDENAGQFWDASGSLSIPVVMPGQSTSWTIAVPYLSNATNNPICSVTSVQADSAY